MYKHDEVATADHCDRGRQSLRYGINAREAARAAVRIGHAAGIDTTTHLHRRCYCCCRSYDQRHPLTCSAIGA